MSNLLSSAAVGAKTGADAQEIAFSYLETNPTMALNRTQEAAAKPKGMNAADSIDPTR
ncbi:MAG: hypothetical protein JNM12_06865 [Alphaproteobacteria bacterium]|jgi:hypothetical protein|nr:hypothetical protein [Alphaproteobacteria bacterium]MCC7035829.1 hypothetical protein [Alphaproteobacteria bacterium]